MPWCADFYQRAWVNVLPSVYLDCYGHHHLIPELMGNTLLEAMACGTPAICSRVGGMPEFIRHGETGFIFDSLPELSDQLRRLAGSPRLVETIGRQARQAARQEFSHEAAAGKLLAVYRSLLATGEKAAA